MADIVEMELKKIPVDKIDIGKWNTRTENVQKDIDELAKSIAEIGLQQPPIAFEKKDGRFDIIIGQRRFIAMKRLGMKEIPLLVRKPLREVDAKIASLSENIHRLKLSPRDMLDVCTYLINELGSVKKVAKVLGVGTITVKEYLGLRVVPEPILKLVEERKLSKGVAKRIAISMPDDESAIEMAKRVSKMTTPEKERALDVIRENPEITKRPVTAIIKEAEKRKKRKKIVVHLAEDLIRGIDEASEDLGLDRETTIETAINDWLNDKGYL